VLTGIVGEAIKKVITFREHFVIGDEKTLFRGAGS
jgi:hypothetical protein